MSRGSHERGVGSPPSQGSGVIGSFVVTIRLALGGTVRAESDAGLSGSTSGAGTEAFDAIAKAYRPQLIRYVRRLVPDSRAEDAVQQALLKAWAAICDGTAVSDLRPWLYRIAHNSALDAVRHQAHERDHLTEAEDPIGVPAHEQPDTEVERRMLVRRLLSAVSLLPTRQREALLQTALVGKSYEDVAMRLGLSEEAVRQLVCRARRAVRRNHNRRASHDQRLTSYDHRP